MAESTTGLVIEGLEKLQAKFQGMNSRATTGMQSYLNTTVYRQIQNAQMNRWMTEGASEGNKWDPISSEYSKFKLRRYGGGTKYKWVGGRGENMPWIADGNWGNYPGSGTKMLIATGALASNVIGPQEGSSPFGLTGPFTAHRKLVTEKSIFVGVDGDDLAVVRKGLEDQTKKSKGKARAYARDVNEKRDFVTLGVNTKTQIMSGISRYIKAGASR